MQQIKNWFNNLKSKAPKATPKAVNVIVGQAASSSRVPTEAQVYSKMYYHARVKPRVDDELQGKLVAPGTRITTTARVTGEIYAKESEEVQREVKMRRAQLVEEANAEAATYTKLLEDEDREYEPEEYDRSVSDTVEEYN